MNKYILSYRNGEPTLLGSMQMILTLVCGYIQMWYPCGMGPKVCVLYDHENSDLAYVCNKCYALLGWVGPHSTQGRTLLCAEVFVL